MKTQDEIKARQRKFITSYHFPKNDSSPQMKAMTAAVNASVRTRNYPVYSNDSSMHREAVTLWKTQLEKLGEKYKTTKQNKEQFLKDVYSLKECIDNSEYASAFAGGEIRIGQCQKSLSIYLKWMWCQGELAEVPPVCPIDGRILSKCYKVLKHLPYPDKVKLKLISSTRWSILNDKETYEKLVEITEDVTKKQKEEKTCIWELFTFE